jgi:effector-binding domain-containing protein
MEYDVTLREVASEHLASVRGTYPTARLPEVIPAELARVMSELTAEGIQPSGAAIAIYHGWTGDMIDAEIGFTIRGVFFPRDPKGPIRASRTPAGKVLFTVHVGRYADLEAAYKAIRAYAEVNRLELAGVMWERYLSDPVSEPDPDRHVTEVYWPVA